MSEICGELFKDILKSDRKEVPKNVMVQGLYNTGLADFMTDFIVKNDLNKPIVLADLERKLCDRLRARKFQSEQVAVTMNSLDINILCNNIIEGLNFFKGNCILVIDRIDLLREHCRQTLFHKIREYEIINNTLVNIVCTQVLLPNRPTGREGLPYNFDSGFRLENENIILLEKLKGDILKLSSTYDETEINIKNWWSIMK